MAKFAANANLSATIKILLFQATHKYVPKMNFDPVDLSKESMRKRLANTKVYSIASDMEKV